MAEHKHAVLVNFGTVQRVNSREANLQPFRGSDVYRTKMVRNE